MKDRYLQLIRYLPEHLRSASAEAYSHDLEELRLRSGQRLSAVYSQREHQIGSSVTADDIAHLAAAAAHGSLYAAVDSLKNGYITVEGGCRIGFCGTAVIKGADIANLRNLSSANIRLAKEVKTAAAALEAAYSGRFENTLIIAPPGLGKTTLLRDIVRRLSDKGTRLSVVDERGEIAAAASGVCGFDVGKCTDVLTGCPKAEGILMMLRAMNPQIIAVDEITAPEDIAALDTCRSCGVGLLATVHGHSAADTVSRPIMRQLLASGIFPVTAAIMGSSRRIVIERRYGPC